MRRVTLVVVLIPVAAAGEFLPALPALAPFIGKAVTGVLDYLTISNIKSSINDLTDYVNKSTVQIFSTVAAMWWVANEERGAWGFVQNRAKDAGAAFTEIQQDNGIMWHHLYKAVLPHSLGHLEGKIGAQTIGPLRREIRTLATGETTLTKQINTINTWIDKVATPLLTGWTQFIKWWDTNFAVPAATLIDWLQKPEDFAKWATPPLAGALVAYYADPKHKQTRDDLAAVIADAFHEESGNIWNSVTLWLTTDS